MRIVVCGVAGSGKTVVGRALAERLGYPFLDADDFHSAANKAKMAACIPLTDEDRRPWLDSLNANLKSRVDVVLACSALTNAYRARLGDQISDIRWIALVGDHDLLALRIGSRQGHFMPPGLLDSQLTHWEPLVGGTTIDVGSSIDQVVASALSSL